MADERPAEGTATDVPTDDGTDVLPLGRAPRPSTGPELAVRLRDAFVEHAHPDVAHVERLRVHATVDGPDVPALDVDLSGLVVRTTSGGGRPTETTLPPVPVGDLIDPAARREDGTLRHLRIEAHPVTVEGVPVDVVVDADDVRFRWVEGADGSLGVELVDPGATGSGELVRGFVRVTAPQRDLIAAARRLIEKTLQETGGLVLTSFDVQVDSAGPRAATAGGFARVRKRILSASIRARIAVDVDEHLVLTVRELSLTSRNPVVAAALLVARNHVDEARGRTVDLAAELPPGLRLADVRLDVDESVAISARFA
ncbi:hypothetical protein [Cellulosimicrobium arenosum]|uniref:Uncharacterized protein n=1 Tax=Cellulosimicrobium arenosum TaxID=2708133 RepID=A0A927IYU0_9MICO|nr:hypothetical protein [Cellulosimicrobium arenosum]MBD8077935.1 hypothetical protein [Cellulosimicrobium arenosum]